MSLSVRLVSVLLGLHLLSSMGAGALTWWWLDHQVNQERQDRATAIARTLSQGGFSPTPEVLQRMADLAGARFHIARGDEPPRSESVRIHVDAVTIDVDTPDDAWQRMSQASLVAALVFLAGGAAIFAVSAWWTARTITRPIEHLAAAARAIGAGQRESSVPITGSGEVAALARDLEQMRVQLGDFEAATRRQEHLATLGLFTATIAHEVRNPLSAIRLTVQMQRRQQDSPGLAMIENEIERLDLVVDELLGLVRGMRVELVTCQLEQVVDDVVRLLARQAQHAGVELHRSGTATVLADPQRLRQLLLNLLLNAIQAQPEGGTVTITITADGFTVADDGPGVDPVLVPHLFRSFASNRHEGTGLGLHLASTIAQAHDATLRYEPGIPRGARFSLVGLRST